MVPVLPEPEVARLVGLVEDVGIMHTTYHGAVAPKPVHVPQEL